LPHLPKKTLKRPTKSVAGRHRAGAWDGGVQRVASTQLG
jgi:hypothetical protein